MLAYITHAVPIREARGDVRGFGTKGMRGVEESVRWERRDLRPAERADGSWTSEIMVVKGQSHQQEGLVSGNLPPAIHSQDSETHPSGMLTEFAHGAGASKGANREALPWHERGVDGEWSRTPRGALAPFRNGNLIRDEPAQAPIRP